ncbi:MAG: heavy-metal-associated domain-containing protein [Rhodocyclaceae bacterium]
MIELTLPDMTCGHCASVVTRSIRALDPQARVVVTLATHQVNIESGESRDNLAEALAEAGYPATD